MSDEGSRRISRRQFIHTSAGAMAFLGAGQIDARRQRVRGACMHDCPDTCSWIVTTENGRAVGLEGDPDHPLTRGALCEKLDGFLTDVVYNPDRVLTTRRSRWRGSPESRKWGQVPFL